MGRLRAFYFLSFAALGAVVPYLSLLLERRGLSARVIGALTLTLPVGALFAPSLWASRADSTGRPASVLAVVSVGCAIALIALSMAAELVAIGGVLLFYSVARAGIVPVADGWTHDRLGADADAFSSVRVWGSAGFAVTAAVIGWTSGASRPAVTLGIGAALYIASAVIVLGSAKQSEPSALHMASVAPGWRALPEAHRRGLTPLLVGSAAYYVGHGIYDVYFGLHIRACGHDDGVVGTAWLVGVGCEIAFMLSARPLLRRAPSGWLLVVAAVLAIVRWGLIGQVTAAWALIAVSTLHAATFGLWYLALSFAVQQRSPGSLRASMQSLVHAALSIGMIGGYASGGALFDYAGGAATFGFAAGAAAVAAICYVPFALKR